jgi:deoxyribodipyrimidine photo-lyase
MELSLFIFRRDLRLEDNTGLIYALKHSKHVIPAFIFTPEQIDHNPYRSDHCLKFMIESLQELDLALQKHGTRLYVFKGKVDQVVETCLKELPINGVIVNRDYTPYSIKRDEGIETLCKKKKISFHSFHDSLLISPEESLKSDGKPYLVFTPYFRNATETKVPRPVHNSSNNYFNRPISFAETSDFLSKMSSFLQANPRFKGGRSEALKILNHLGSLNEYGILRDYPAEDYSSHLSAYLKFNVCSIREVYIKICEKLSPHHDLIRSLYWRDFFTTIAFFFPHVFGGSFHKKYDAIKWPNDKAAFKLWCEGKTGFPIVDAGMRELNTTGFMHNRVRMIVGSFLVKDLHIDWRWGEKYFAQKLIDYDPCVNNGNWQWVASTGTDAQPYFRIFNPWRQQEKFDPDCLYIKKWIPELEPLAPKTIHSWTNPTYHKQWKNYPSPMIDHTIESKLAIKYYLEANSHASVDALSPEL